MFPANNVFLGKLARKRYMEMKRETAAIRIQRHVRGRQARKLYKKVREAAIVIQGCLRGMLARKEFTFRRKTRAAIKLQVRMTMLEC
jgi:myosin-5